MAKTKSETATGKSKKTEYRVLRHVVAVEATDEDQNAEPERWEVVATLVANSEKQAKRLYFERAAASVDSGEFSETLVAVPARSWSPAKLSVVRQPRIVFG